jgi:hypothetical protein
MTAISDPRRSATRLVAFVMGLSFTILPPHVAIHATPATPVVTFRPAIPAAHPPAQSFSASAKASTRTKTGNSVGRIDFSGYTGGPVDQWLETRKYTFQKDAKNRQLLGLSIDDGILLFEAKARMSGVILNDSVSLDRVQTIKINWGVRKYPEDVSYQKKINNEALMVYIFFGRERIASGHILVPNSPYFIGLFLCQDDQVNFPYKGRYFHAGGRFVCLGKAEPDRMTISEFDLDRSFKSYFNMRETPSITGIGFGVDTSKAGADGQAAAFIKSIEFFEHPVSGKASSSEH